MGVSGQINYEEEATLDRAETTKKLTNMVVKEAIALLDICLPQTALTIPGLSNANGEDEVRFNSFVTVQVYNNSLLIVWTIVYTYTFRSTK